MRIKYRTRGDNQRELLYFLPKEHLREFRRVVKRRNPKATVTPIILYDGEQELWEMWLDELRGHPDVLEAL